MAIPVIYQGDDTNFNGTTPLSVSLSTDFDLDGHTVTLWFCGCRRDFTGLTGRAATLPLSFSAKETGSFPIGTHNAQIAVFDATGRKRTASDSVRIRVTDDLREAYGAEGEQDVDVEIEMGVDPTRLMEGQTLRTNTPNGMRQAIKKIAQALGATVSVLAVAALPAFGASVQTAPLGDLDLDQNPSVVTNVDLSGLLTEHQDISGKADKTNTYTKAETDAAYIPISGGPVFSSVRLFLNDELNEQGMLRLELPNGEHVTARVFVSSTQITNLGAVAVSTNYTEAVAAEFANGTRVVDKAWRASDADAASVAIRATAIAYGGTDYEYPDLLQAATNAAESVVREKSLGGIWDQQLGVWWTPIMQNGALRYVATTNVNLSAGGNQ